MNTSEPEFYFILHITQIQITGYNLIHFLIIVTEGTD